MNKPVARTELRQAGPARFTSDEFLRMEALGAFEGHKVELADGEIVEEPLPGTKHGRLQARLMFLLSSCVSTPYELIGELSVRISDLTVRDFDAGIILDNTGDVAAVDPGAVILAVEVAVTTLSTDLHTKAREYAGAGIPHYWVVDAAAGVVHAMASPGAEGYAERKVIRFDEPLALPGGGAITIAERPA